MGDRNPYSAPESEPIRVGPAPTPTGDRPWLVISVAEAFALASLICFVYCGFDPAMRASPRAEEWFGWAPEPARFWLLNLSFAPVLGGSLAVFPLIAYANLPRGLRRRFPLRLGFWGSPPLVGGAVFAAFGVLCIAAFMALATLED